MQKIDSEKSLKAAILELEEKHAYEESMLREQFKIAYESFKPINLIKSAFKEVVGSDDLKDELINSSIGLTVGFISKKLFEGVSSNPLKKILGTVLMFGIKSVVAKNPDIIKIVVNKLFNTIRHKFDNYNETENKDEAK